MARPKPSTRAALATNRRARHEYHILEEFEAGMVLSGSEVKSLRTGQASLAEAFCLIRKDEVFLVGMHVPEYPHAGKNGHPPVRDRKLLLHRREIEKLNKKVRERGITLVPLQIYVKERRIKCQLALVQGKKMFDKRQVQKERDAKREMERAMGRRR